MKRLLAVLLLILGLGMTSGCGPKTERRARLEEQRNQNIKRNMEGLERDIEVFWLMDEPLRLSRWDPPVPHD